MNHRLSEKWIKASIAGTIWAASEIVLGSFMHNLRIPFSGNILTAIGIIILISISHTWRERGLFWRAGLICAIMKTISPSAVIFGPMIAIFSEGLLLEISVRILGHTIPGYLLGAMMAMSWNLFQKIMNYIIFYGSGIVEVYTNLLKLAQKQLNIQTDIVWLPIIILLIVYALFGMAAALVGIRTGRTILKQTSVTTPLTLNNGTRDFSAKPEQKFKYSILWLAADIILILSAMILINKTTWMVWSPTVTAIIGLWAVRYRKAFRQLLRPKFWIFFVFITLLTAFVFTKVQNGEDVLLQGLLTGIQMNFRALLMMMGFSVLGTELYNPVIREYFTKTAFKNLPLALELSFESLPSFIAQIPDFRTLVRNPVFIFGRVISQAGDRLSEIRGSNSFCPRIFIISGSVGAGKTTFARQLTGLLKGNDIAAGGILSERIMSGSERTGYNIVDIETGERKKFLDVKEDHNSEKIGKFTICNEGLAFGNSIVGSLKHHPGKIAVIDEIGLLELNGKGWADVFKDLLDGRKNHIVITVRDSFTEDVKGKWNLSDAEVFKTSETSYSEAGKIILEKVNS